MAKKKQRGLKNIPRKQQPIRAVLMQRMAGLGMTRYQLAAKSGVPYGSISRWFNGARPTVTSETVDKLAQALDMELVAKG